MSSWYVIVGAIVFFGLLILVLRSRWYRGCALAFLGAILGGGAAFAAGWYYTRGHAAPRPRHDMDFSGLENLIIWLLIVPVLSAVLV
jgi:hypothetical protein